MTTIDDIRSLDPVGYVRSVGLRPEDSYGFCPGFSRGNLYFARRKG